MDKTSQGESDKPKITIEILEDDEGNTWKPYIIPVLPAELEINSPSGNESANTIKLGEVTIRKMRGLRTLKIDSFFPAKADLYPFCVTNEAFMRPETYIDAFEGAKENKRTCKIVIEGYKIPAFYVSIEEFSWTYSQTSDVEYSLSLKEYRPYGNKSRNLETLRPAFDDDSQDSQEVSTVDALGQIREPTDYAVGDMVLVEGPYFSTPDGVLRLLEPGIHVMTDPFSAAKAAALMLWEAAQMAPLVGARCIIIDKYMDKVVTLPLPLIGDQYETYTAPYAYCIADLDTRETIGWVSKKQLARL